MAKYTVTLGGGAETVFDADSLAAARKYAEAHGWNPDFVNAGDWITYPTSGYPGTTTPSPKEAEGLQASITRKRAAQEKYKYTGGEIPSELLLTPEEREHLVGTYTAPPAEALAVSRAKAQEIMGGTTTPPTEWEENYADYLEFIKTDQGKNFPTPKDINDYRIHYEEWMGNASFYQAGYTQDQIDSYDRFSAFARQYGDLNDFQAKDLGDFLANYDQAQQQLDAWVQEAGPEAAGFTDNQVREYYAFKEYQSAYGEPGEWKPVDIGDFFTNYDTAQQQLNVWKQQAGEVEKYELEPGEAARRREKAYQRQQYIQQESFRETPQYQQPFQPWLQEQAGFSRALQEYTEREFPSLRSEFQATQPRLTGFPTREAARAEATRREQAWTGWLGGMAPEIEQRYWGQRPEQRGERLWMQAPGLRAINW